MREVRTAYTTSLRTSYLEVPVGQGTFFQGDCLDILNHLPFAGSGQTVLACEKLGRRHVSIEILKEYVDYAVKRLRVATQSVPSNL
jgi:DNA modification methylase